MSLYGAIDKKYCGSQTVTAADVTATFTRVNTGVLQAQYINVTIQRASTFGPSVEADAVCSYTPTTGAINVADGAATYTLTAGDFIRWIAVPPDERV